MTSNPYLYLAKADWSPRFDNNFYSFTMDNKRLVTSEDENDVTNIIPDAIHGRNQLPAYYYEIVVHRGREANRLWRRYSHFKWLNEQIKSIPPPSLSESSDAAASTSPSAASFPSGTCFLIQKQDDEFAQSRMLCLRDWLNDLLILPGYASHPAVKVFLELE